MEISEAIVILAEICILLSILLLGVWLFFKIRTIVAKKKLNRPDISKEIKREINRQPFPKISFISCISVFALYITYSLVCVLILVIEFFLLLISIPMIIDGDGNTAFLDKFNNFTYHYLYGYIFIVILFFIALFVFLSRGIYVNSVYRKKIIDIEMGIPTPKVPLTSRQLIKRILIICGIVLAGIFYLITERPIHNSIFKSVNLSEFASSPDEITSSWYCFHEDRLLIYTNDSDERLISTDLKGKNKKVISSSEELIGANIYMVYNNEMFYYTVRNNSLKKINLDTGEITTVVPDKHIYIIPDTLNKGTVLVNYKVNSTPHFATLNLNDGTLYDIQEADFTSTKAHFYDENSQSLYFVSGTNLYKNEIPIYEFTHRNPQNLAFVQDDYIIGINGNTMVILDKDTYQVVDEKTLDMNFSLIPSTRKGGSKMLMNNNDNVGGDPVFTATHPVFTIKTQNGLQDIYIFNSKTFSFEKLINTNTYNSFVQKYDDNYIVQTPKETIIYNISDKEVKTYNSLNYTVEDGYIYLFSYKNNNQEIYKPEYKILKEKL